MNSAVMKKCESEENMSLSFIGARVKGAGFVGQMRVKILEFESTSSCAVNIKMVCVRVRR
jgi:hypothetical protein